MCILDHFYLTFILTRSKTQHNYIRTFIYNNRRLYSTTKESTNTIRCVQPSMYVFISPPYASLLSIFRL